MKFIRELHFVMYTSISGRKVYIQLYENFIIFKEQQLENERETVKKMNVHLFMVN